MAELAVQARAAYDQKRIRECLALTKALAAADPGNAEAEMLESAIRADMQQDLHDARALLEQSGTKEETKKYRKAAEIILIKTLYLDPENEEAKALLQSARGVPALRDTNFKPQAKPKPELHPNPDVHQRAPRPVEADARTAPEREEDIPFTASPTAIPVPEEDNERKKLRLKLPLAAVAILLLGGGLVLILQSRPNRPGSLAARVGQAEPLNHANTPAAAVQTQQPPASVPNAPPPSANPPRGTAAQPAAIPATRPSATPSSPAVTPNNVSTTSEMGKLAVSSTAAAEIYMGGRYLGSTPTTLELPGGRQTLEYRHGDLRTVVSHIIKVNETTTASITFQLTVQINANPWAQVFLDGAPRRPLGQTPLSGVTVPIGSVLIFENPNFPSKSYRVMEKDTAIQVNFP
jgi:hypothetical protein